MHINRIRSGKQKQYLKVLLRRSRREGRRVVKCTVMNLTKWSQEDLARLESALQTRRCAISTDERDQADRLVLRILTEPGDQDPSTPWQILCALSDARRQVG